MRFTPETCSMFTLQEMGSLFEIDKSIGKKTLKSKQKQERVVAHFEMVDPSTLPTRSVGTQGDGLGS